MNDNQWKIPKTWYDRLVDWLSIGFLAASGFYLWANWQAIPQEIPTHYGFGGQPDAWGSKSSCVILLVIGVVNLLWFFPKDLFLGKVISLVLVILTLADVLVSPYFRYHRYRYSINEECIDIREGYLFVERNIVPIERLHKLQTVKGPLDRFFRVAKVVVTTAGGDVTIRFLEEEKAEAIAESLRNRINQIVKEERNAKEQAADGQA